MLEKMDIESISRVYMETLYYRFMDVFTKKKVIVSINPSCQQNFINALLVNRLQVSTKNMQRIEVEGNTILVFKSLKLTMDKYVLHSNFCAIDMNDVDVILGYP
jgi:hypothetical protein